MAEALYSLEHLMAISGDPTYGDRMERIAWNALPATFSPDMWTHQYDQQVNQVQCAVQEKPIFEQMAETRTPLDWSQITAAARLI